MPQLHCRHVSKVHFAIPSNITKSQTFPLLCLSECTIKNKVYLLWQESPINSPVLQDNTLHLDDDLVEEVERRPVGIHGRVSCVILNHVALDDEVECILEAFLPKKIIMCED